MSEGFCQPPDKSARPARGSCRKGDKPAGGGRARVTARELSDDYEVIVVEDGSPDHTGALLDEMATVYPWLKVVHHPRNRGYGGALRSGFAAASKELVFYTDGDAQYDPREMAQLWERMGDGVDLVNGYKISRSDPLHRIIIGRVYHHVVKRLFGLKVRDVDCDFRLMRRRRYWSSGRGNGSAF